MQYELLADLSVGIHALFVCFVVGGGLIVLRWPRLAWLHLPAAFWGVAIELGGWVCPLTHLENRWRLKAGLTGYGGTFIQQYIEPLIYPLGLTPRRQMLFGVLAFAVNSAVYWVLWKRKRNTR